jgi:hypothetical protein
VGVAWIASLTDIALSCGAAYLVLHGASERLAKTHRREVSLPPFRRHEPQSSSHPHGIKLQRSIGKGA